MLAPYDYCSCGSGKKFKWCCQEIYPGIQRAMQLDARGQHAVALSAIDETTRQFPNHPEVWGRKAYLLFANDKTEEADQALQKAFELYPDYPYGLLLRALFRLHEGEVGGALLLARRAAEAYHPETHDALSQVYSIIFECEMKHNRPIAGREALQLLLRHQPSNDEARDGFTTLFGPEGELPEAARREYTLLDPPQELGGESKQAWVQALEQKDAPRLTDLVGVFESLTQQNGDSAPAWFNLALARAWLGQNREALEGLDRYLHLEEDIQKGSAASAMAEVLRCGQGLEDQADHFAKTLTYQIQKPEPMQAMLREWIEAQRLVPVRNDEEGLLIALVLETTTGGLITVGKPSSDGGRFGGTLVLAGNILQFTSNVEDAYSRIQDELRQKLSIGLGELRESRSPVRFRDVINEALFFPFSGDEQEQKSRVREHARQHYEDVWPYRPRRSLGGQTPAEAATHPHYRKILLGVIQFIEDCARGGMLATYDFNGLREKLDLWSTGGAPSTTGSSGADAGDISLQHKDWGETELRQLPTENLSREQLEQAFQVANKLGVGDLGAQFARELVKQPVEAGQSDRYPWYSALIQHALGQGDTDAALDHVNEGERVDCEHNEGQRRNDYELRRGQLHAKRGEVDVAGDVFQRLIDRVPDDMNLRGRVVEAMLSAKDGPRALKIAEEGLAVAQETNDRDSQRYLQELVDAARRQVGS